MKSLILIFSLMLFLISCHSSDSDKTTFLLDTPTGEVDVTVSDKKFTIDFNRDAACTQNVNYDVWPDEFAKLKTRDDLIAFYRSLTSRYQPGYSSMSDNNESVFARSEYMLAQECFSDNCDSKFRTEVLQLAANHQKTKYGEYISLSCAQKSGVFLMAVILVKERNSSEEFIDTETLQKALLCLSSDEFVDENFSNTIIECSKRFLATNK